MVNGSEAVPVARAHGAKPGMGMARGPTERTKSRLRRFIVGHDAQESSDCPRAAREAWLDILDTNLLWKEPITRQGCDNQGDAFVDDSNVVEHRLYSEYPTRLEYQLTEKRSDIGLALRALKVWRDRYG